MEANIRIVAKEVKEMTGPVVEAMEAFDGYTYRTGFEHLAWENYRLK